MPLFYDEVNSRLLIGSLLIQPQYLNNEKYPLSKDDFKPCEFHLRLYQAINALAKHGAKSIELIDLYNLANKHREIKELFDDNDLKDFIDTIKQLTNIENFDLYYNEVRKNTLLREYQANGFNTDKFINCVSNVSIESIVEYYDGIFLKLKRNFYNDKTTEEVKAGNKFKKIKEQFKEEPAYGATTFSKYLNSATRGWKKGQLTMYGCVSGSGKTTLGLMNIALTCCKQMWDDNSCQFIDNKCYQHEGGLFIQYELNTQEELMPKLVASISGVPTYHILDGKYEQGEEDRVDKAIDILEQSNIWLVSMPSFTNDKIKSLIREYKINHNVGYVVFDYVSQTSTVASDIAKKNGIATRSDQVLADMVANLKEAAIENNVAILTFCQTNVNVNNQEILDAGCLAGSRAMQDKLDVGGIIMPLRAQEKEVCDMIMESGQYGKLRPNRCLHAFKIRFGSYSQHMKVWFNLDLNTGACVDCFCTDAENKPYTIPKTNLIYQ